MHCMTASSTRAYLPAPCAYQRSTYVGTDLLWGPLFIHVACSDTSVPCKRDHRDSRGLQVATWTSCASLHSLNADWCRLCVDVRRMTPSAPPVVCPDGQGRGAGPSRSSLLAFRLRILAPKLWRIISAASLSYPNVFSLCFLMGWGPLHSHYRNLLSALSVLFVAKASAYDWTLKSVWHAVCTLTMIWPKKKTWTGFYWAHCWNPFQNSLLNFIALLIFTINMIKAVDKESLFTGSAEPQMQLAGLHMFGFF